MTASVEYHIMPDYPRQAINALIQGALSQGIHVFAEDSSEGYILNFEASDELAMQDMCLTRGIIPTVIY